MVREEPRVPTMREYFMGMTPNERLSEAIQRNELDMEMLPYIEKLNHLGLQSLYCCSGHGNVGYILFEAPDPEYLVQKLQIAYRKRDWPIAPVPDDYKDVGGIEIPYAVIGPSTDSDTTVNLSFNNLDELGRLLDEIQVIMFHGNNTFNVCSHRLSCGL
jgi:hypothetical protein